MPAGEPARSHPAEGHGVFPPPVTPEGCPGHVVIFVILTVFRNFRDRHGR
ncbi:hypothetical protein ASZ90_000323 [hydrocarbon metagenome]|uniref:Uncharacterized protein n=1 Tax=hydrocarbon metagenome TaxID=938273 RepID=A0A0W8GAX0_9ZZZZ